jgi:hypothetical protein
LYPADSYIVNVLNYAWFLRPPVREAEPLQNLLGDRPGSIRQTAQKASLIGRIRHHFAVFSVLYKAESGFQYFVAVYGYRFRKLMILIGPRTKFSIKKCTAVYTLDELAEDHVLAIEMRRLHSRDEELAPVGVGPGICHRQNSRLVMRYGQVLHSK